MKTNSYDIGLFNASNLGGAASQSWSTIASEFDRFYAARWIAVGCNYFRNQESERSQAKRWKSQKSKERERELNHTWNGLSSRSKL